MPKRGYEDKTEVNNINRTIVIRTETELSRKIRIKDVLSGGWD